ncbi:hypothetical protein CO613_05565 [Lysobacteraceae bacterium NML07-0707]|nr:hypothetical protein CO613_05565 [Xanthomonadaceae bacterium NML07-0707]
MAGRPPEVDHVKAAFLREIKAAEDLVMNTGQEFPRVIYPNAKVAKLSVAAEGGIKFQNSRHHRCAR